MSRISYVNGEFLPHEKATIPIEDRGLQFSDAVYEVVPFFNASLFDFDPHYDRLERSLGALAIENPITRDRCQNIFNLLIKKNALTEGIVYLQITRGVAPRDHAFPEGKITPTVIATAKPLDMDLLKKRNREGVAVLVYPENRWLRRDVKSTSLLGNVLAKEAAAKAGCYEAWFVDQDNQVTEGTSSNAWVVNPAGVLITRRTNHQILSGITRRAVMKGSEGLCGHEERNFTVNEAKNSKEAFLTSTTSCVMPVVKIDDTVINDGKPGPVTRAAQEAYWDLVKEQTGFDGS